MVYKFVVDFKMVVFNIFGVSIPTFSWKAIDMKILYRRRSNNIVVDSRAISLMIIMSLTYIKEKGENIDNFVNIQKFNI